MVYDEKGRNTRNGWLSWLGKRFPMWETWDRSIPLTTQPFQSDLVAPSLPSAFYIFYVICELLHSEPSYPMRTLKIVAASFARNFPKNKRRKGEQHKL